MMRRFGNHVVGAATMAALTLVMTAATADAASFKCKLDGTFFPPTNDVASSDVLTTAIGSCMRMGKTVHTGVLTTGNVPDLGGCVAVSTNQTMVAVNKKGDSVYYTVSGTQCFKDANGQVPTTAGFCGPPTDTRSSTLVATITITGGTGKRAGASGSAAMTGLIDHCDASAPFGNSFAARIQGSITP